MQVQRRRRKVSCMVRTGWQRTWVRILITAMTVAVMVVIFLFSMEDAESSDQTSGQISQTVVRVVYPDYEQMRAAEQKVSFLNVQHAVRKTAHFIEYLTLGLLIRLCLESWFGGKRKRLTPEAWASGTLYACTDELHQLLIDGRSGQWMDVLLDSSGVLTGVLLSCLILSVSRKRGE